MSSHLAETEPLLPQKRLHGWRPHPRWLLPLALVASLARGLTLAARVQIVTQLSCDELHRASQSTIDSPSPAESSASISESCFTDPTTQASAAQIQMLLTVIAGALTAVTAGRWGKWGDSSGRNMAMSAALLGLTTAESIYGIVSIRHLPFHGHGHKLLILSPIIEGLFGSWPTLQANINAYISDVTPTGSTLYSRVMGILYLGFAIGPSIASLVLRQMASQSLAPLFFLSSGAYALALLFILLVVPESLHSGGKPLSAQSAMQESTPQSEASIPYILTPLKRLLAPIAALRPRHAGAMRLDYTLTIIAVSYFIYLTSLALYQLKYLYAEHVFSWDAERLGYYISYMGFARAVTLLFLLPMWIHFFRPRPSRGRLGVSLRRELNFDLSLVRVSILLDFLSHTLVILSPSNSQTWFILSTTLTSLGSTSMPSYSSTVLGYARYRAAQGEQQESEEEVGVLFGALAVLQSLGQTIIGPIMFGVVYSLTVSTYPRGVFVLACACAGTALMLMCIARPRKRLILVNSRRDPRIRDRGRSWMPKDIVRA